MSDFKTYIEFQKGDMPLILSVCHGGKLHCEDIPKRTTGILGIDGETIEIAKRLITSIQNYYKEQFMKAQSPSYIISHVPRSRIDINREESEAYMPRSQIAKRIYRFYHTKIKKIILDNLKVYERSVLIDLHGFEKANRPPGFRDVDIVLGTNNLESFYPEKIPKKNWGNNIRGKIVQKFTELNIPIAPSHPRRREYVLTGGYITKKYGASQIPNSQVLQIELSDRIRIKDTELREKVIHELAKVFFEDVKLIKRTEI